MRCFWAMDLSSLSSSLWTLLCCCSTCFWHYSAAFSSLSVCTVEYSSAERSRVLTDIGYDALKRPADDNRVLLLSVSFSLILCFFRSWRLSWLATRSPVFERSLNVFRINVSFRIHWRHIVSTRCKTEHVGPSLVNVHAHAAAEDDDDDDVVMMKARCTTALAMHAGDKDASYCYTRCNKNNKCTILFPP